MTDSPAPRSRGTTTDSSRGTTPHNTPDPSDQAAVCPDFRMPPAAPRNTMRSQGSAPLPSWLIEATPYQPPRDRDGYLRHNVLRLASALTVFRAEDSSSSSPLDRALGRVPAGIRLFGLAAAVLCVSLARNMAFVWVMLACALVALAMRPPQVIVAVLGPALAIAVASALVNLPAVFMLGQVTAPVRVASKTLVTLALVCGLARTTTPEDLLGGLASLGLSPTVVLTLDLAIRDLALIGSEATKLCEALELRSVGHNPKKTAGAAGVLGTTFLRAQRHAAAQAEAMALRGYDGRAPVRAHVRAGWEVGLYVVLVACMVAGFVYLECAL